MSKFYGQLGYGDQEESAPGVWRPIITEITYYGDVIQEMRRFGAGEEVNPDLTMMNSISIVADAYANEHIHALRYVRWSGACWKVVTVQVASPRLILRLGGVYDGPTS